MPRLSPPSIDVPASAPGDPRIGHLLGSALRQDERPEAVIVGFPTDEGVRRNDGRVGAVQGPAALRELLYRLTPDPRSKPHHKAPGVSAPAPSGLGAELWFAAAYEAGRSPVVSSADVVELSPRLDAGDQTARLAALTVWWLLRGRAERS